MVEHTCNVHTQKTEGGVLEGNGHPQLQRVQGQPGLHKIVSQNTINERLESASMVNSQAVPGIRFRSQHPSSQPSLTPAPGKRKPLMASRHLHMQGKHSTTL